MCSSSAGYQTRDGSQLEREQIYLYCYICITLKAEFVVIHVQVIMRYDHTLKVWNGIGDGGGPSMCSSPE